MTTTRKKLNITITGDDIFDLMNALDDINEKIEKDYLSGVGSNETGDYEFVVTEEGN